MPGSPTQNPAPTKFSAPWSRQLGMVTLLCGVILFGISAILLAKAPPQPPEMYKIGIWIPPAIFLLCALFSVRGYRLQGSQLLVLRPGWRTRISLSGVQSASHDPDATRGSIRIFGNGGLFGYSGLFRNQKLGRYRAFATDFTRTVVIRMPVKTIVVTPDDPERFVRQVNRIGDLADAD